MARPMILRVSEWAPDMPDYMSGQCAVANNVIPRTPQSYGPLSSPVALTNALTSRCQGAYFGLDTGGNVHGFAGDANDLYEYTASAGTWVNASKSAGVYSIPSDAQWKFLLFGSRIIAMNITDPVQSFILGASTDFADLIVSANPPKARYGAVIKSFLMLCNTIDNTYGAQPQRAWWSRNGDPTQFDAPGSALANQFQTSFQDLLGDGGWIQGVIGNLGTADGVIFMEHDIVRVVWVGGDVVFNFFPIGGRGTPAPGSIARLDTNVFYLGEDGFYVFDGTNSRPIGANRVDKTFYADLDQNYFGLISSAIDPINKLYIVAYPGSGHNGSTCNKLLIYNWQLDRWSDAAPGDFELIARGLSFGYTLDQIYTVLGYTLDNMPFILDSRVWTGGALLLALFDSAHKLAYFTGKPLAATVDMNEVQPAQGGVTKITNSRPIIDGTGANPSVSIGVRNRQQDDISYGAAVAANSLGLSPQRTVGRYVTARLTQPAASSWTHISGCEIEGAPAGVRY